MQIIFLDAGQGDATLITLDDGSMILIDCGSKLNNNVVKQTIAETFKNADLSNKGLLALILTHPDVDHYNLVDELIIKPKVPIVNLYYGGDTSQYGSPVGAWLEDASSAAKVHQLNDPHFDPNPRQELELNVAKTNARIRIVAANVAGKTKPKVTNLNSVVVFLSYRTTNFLLMGDSFTETEEWIIKTDSAKGGTLKKLLDGGDTVLKVGHHGSDSSTGDAWVEWCRPTAAFISSDTQLFGRYGTSTCVDTVIDRLLSFEDPKGTLVLADGGSGNKHLYVRYNRTTKEHELQTTTRWLYTTLVNLKPTGEVDDKGHKLFKADGVSWYYTVDPKTGSESVGPGEGKSFASKNYDKK